MEEEEDRQRWERWERERAAGRGRRAAGGGESSQRGAEGLKREIGIRSIRERWYKLSKASQQPVAAQNSIHPSRPLIKIALRE